MLEFTKIHSACSDYTGGDIKSAVAEAGYDHALMIYTNRVELVRAADVDDVTGLVECRAFNETKELHLIRVGGEWRGRVRDDSQGVDTDILDRDHVLWGKSRGADADGSSILAEDRGIRIRVPLSVEAGKRVCLTIRSYLSPDSFEFDDFRICGIREV